MKLLHQLLSIPALAALLVAALPARAATGPGKPQSLTSPDQVPEGLAKSDWSSIRAAYEAGRHAFQPTASGWQARNPGQQWTTQFDKRGFLATPKDGGWQWGLELQSYGFAENPTAIGGTPAVRADGQRLSYQWDANIQEWFVNDPRGLEHGFTVNQRPALNSSSATLDFLLGVRGGLRPQVTGDALGVEFRDAAGATVLNYSGLKVWDADGKVLASRFAAAGENQVRLLVDERGARYPLTIDPIAQQAYLKASNNAPPSDDQFGISVAVSGDTVVVGATLEDSSTTGVNSTPDELAPDAGAAYVFVRSGTTWTQQAYLKASQVTANDRFGASVAVSGDTVVVGAYQEDSNTTGVNSTPDEIAADSGAAYVFVRSGTTWTQQAYLKASQVSAGDFFGASVAVSGDTVVVGAGAEDSSTTGVNSTPDELAFASGAAYVFVRSGGAWTQQAYLKASQVTGIDFFGASVAVSGDTVVVGASSEDSSTTGVNSTPNELASSAGAAYVFVRSSTTWTQQAYLKASQVTASDNFGISVAVSGDTVVVGASLEDSSTTGVNSTPNEIAADTGAAYVFLRSGTTWTQQAYLKASQVTASDNFGYSVAIAGNTVVVGANQEDSSTTGVNSTPDELARDAGAAYVFVRSGTTWTQQAYLKASQVTASDGFGRSVAVSGDTVVVGAYQEDSSTTGVNSTPNEIASASGAASVFVRSGTTWTQQAYLKASNTPSSGSGAGDQFGRSVAVSGDTVVVGASGEDSNTTGVNSTPNKLAADTGAAYVFVRSGTTWTQQAYLKASQVTANDGFGFSVAVSGDTVVVGASGEGSNTTGVNSTPNELAPDAGAAYVFVRSGTTWTQQAYLKASQVTASDNFGISVAVSGDTVVVGARQEDSSTTGVNSTPDESAANAGAAYVFVRSGGAWTQQAYLKASQVTASDLFGYAVAVSGDTVVVGAYQEDSSTTGVNSTPDESAANAGAAYVFVRSGGAWTQQAYLKASQVTASDSFGYAVAVSGDTVVVGAYQEDSSTTGVNSTPDELASASGAAYVFVRSGGAWTQQAYLKASQVAGSDFFGGSVAVSGDTVVVGATLEDSSTTGVNSTPDELASNAGAAYLFTVTANTAPLATAQSVTTAEDTAVAITLAGTDADGNPLTYAVAAGPAHGSLSGSAPNLSYTPTASYYGSDSFTFTVNDGTVDSATATVSITVTPPALTPIETWRNQYFGSPANTGNGADTASAGDGIANLLKYALVIVPGENAASGLPKSKIAVNGGDRYLALTFKRDPARNDVTIIVQASDDLSGWTEVARCTNGGSFTGSATVTETENPDGTRNVEARDVQAVPGVPRRFMRVSVNHPE
jgi:ABC-type Fe3+-hydroxamate transport system substrate-binding protein